MKIVSGVQFFSQNYVEINPYVCVCVFILYHAVPTFIEINRINFNTMYLKSENLGHMLISTHIDFHIEAGQEAPDKIRAYTQVTSCIY